MWLPNLFAQAPDSLWAKIYGGNGEDRAFSVQQTLNGGYIVAGYTRSRGAGLSDVWLLKTDSIGDTLWTKTYGGSDWDQGYSVQQTLDGGYIVSGCTESFGAGYGDIYLIKTDSIGDTLWTKTYGGSDWDQGYSVQQTLDGGYIVSGCTESFGAGYGDIYLIKTDSIGDTLWTKTYGGPHMDEGFSAQQTTDGGYIVVGYKDGYSAIPDVWLLKTDSIGDTLWTKTYGGSDWDQGYSVQQTLDGGYIVSGCTESFGAGYGDIYLIKTDSIGDTLWTRTYGNTLAQYGGIAQQTADEGYIVAGWTDPGSSYDDIYLVKTDSVGDTLWTGTYGTFRLEWGESVQQTSDGGYIIAGGVWWSDDFDVYLLKIGPESGIERKEYIPEVFYVFQGEPNPFHNKTTIKYEIPKTFNVNISIYNTLGAKIRTLLNKKQNAGIHTITWDSYNDIGNKVPSGFYFLRLEAGEYKGSRKLLLLR